jgi:hypothetical protein
MRMVDQGRADWPLSTWPHLLKYSLRRTPAASGAGRPCSWKTSAPELLQWPEYRIVCSKYTISGVRLRMLMRDTGSWRWARLHDARLLHMTRLRAPAHYYENVSGRVATCTCMMSGRNSAPWWEYGSTRPYEQRQKNHATQGPPAKLPLVEYKSPL